MQLPVPKDFNHQYFKENETSRRERNSIFYFYAYVK